MKRKAMVLLMLLALSVGISACGGKDSAASNEVEQSTESESYTNEASIQPEESADPETENNQENAGEKSYSIGETWVVDGQWNVTVNSVEETSDRNEFSDKEPAAVYLVTYTYENVGYVDDDGFMDGLFISMEDTIVDAEGKMGYSYPGDVSLYAQETPVGATCEAQACIGVDNAGSFKIHITQYDGNGNEQNAVFSIDL